MHWAVYLSIPLLAALIGYGTRVLAVALTLRVVVPRNTGRIAAAVAGQLTGMLDARTLFATVDADRLRAEVEQPLLRAVDQVARDVLAEHHPGVWESLPPIAQELAVKRLQSAGPRIVAALVDGLRDNVETVVDLKRLVTQRLATDPARLARVVRTLVGPDLRWSTYAALVAGLAAGVLEAGVLALTGQPVVLPLFGAAIGAGAGWLAVRLVFWPREPGTLQGSFHRRRAVVAREYGELVAEEVLTPAVLIEAAVHGPGSWRAYEVVAQIVDDVVDEQVRAFRLLVAAGIGLERMPEMKRSAAARALAAIPDTARRAHAYLAGAMDVAGMVDERVRGLSPAGYEQLARPLFQPDSGKLLALAGVIGAVIGVLQLLVLG